MYVSTVKKTLRTFAWCISGERKGVDAVRRQTAVTAEQGRDHADGQCGRAFEAYPRGVGEHAE